MSSLDLAGIHSAYPYSPPSASSAAMEGAAAFAGRDKTEKKKKGEFAALISKTGEPPEAEVTFSSLQEGLVQVKALGKRLVTEITPSAISDYRKAISAFLKMAVSEGFVAKNVDGRLNPKTMSRKQYLLIQTIHEKSDALTKDLLQSQINQITILSKIDELQGLLVDLIT